MVSVISAGIISLGTASGSGVGPPRPSSVAFDADPIHGGRTIHGPVLVDPDEDGEVLGGEFGSVFRDEPCQEGALGHTVAALRYSGMRRWGQPPEATMTSSKVPDLPPEVTTTPSLVSVSGLPR